MINSKSKKLKHIVLPEYTKDKELVMLPINLAGGNILPDEFKHYLPALKAMIRNSPVKEGIGYLTIHEKHVEKGKTQRRGGPHIDGNFIPEPTDNGAWSGPTGGGNGWKVGDDGRSLSREGHIRSYQSPNGGMLITSNYSLCRGWNGQFEGEVGTGGDATPIVDQLDEGFVLEPNVIYLANSQFVHESMPTDKTINRVMIRITLPETAQVLN